MRLLRRRFMACAAGLSVCGPAGWRAKPLTTEDTAHEIAFVRASGPALPGIDTLDPASMLFS